MSVFRCYSEKKPGFDVEAQGLCRQLREQLGVESLESVRILNRYDADHIDPAVYQAAKTVVFSEPQVDDIWDETYPAPDTVHSVLAVEALPGQFDQRADSCAQCIQLQSGVDRPLIAYAKVYLLGGQLSQNELEKIRKYLINPVESREASVDKPATLVREHAAPDRVAVVEGFTALDEKGLAHLLSELGLAMDLDDLKFLQTYFRDEEKRDPTITEVRVVDTYWSDHCRHTTFSTHLDAVDIGAPAVKAAYQRYLDARVEVYGEEKAAKRPQTLMDIATIGTKTLKKRGLLPELDESEEINACSIKVPAVVDGKEQDWLLMFKNETHNHPTEIEPFGGAATCIGGCIRDPLSGRVYVHQAMRFTGGGDPRVPFDQTLEGKLPQRKLAQTAAAGYSSYGNQIGLATGHVAEVYHEGYIAKRLECGAVVGAAPAENVRRERPAPGDVVILLGGRTGRDGIGGATGSSKSHNKKSLTTMASEVQKGNAPEERKIQRLFRNGEITRLIKRCNDFGAGGVSVAIGELADGLEIQLDAVRKKYEGLDGTELAISESQERMAVVVAPEDAARFIAAAEAENLEAYQVAVVTESPRMVMHWKGQTVADLSREFLNTNGAVKHAGVSVSQSKGATAQAPASLREMASSLKCASRRGLTERFDGSIGAGSVLMPFGGKTQRTPAQAMAALFPVLPGQETDQASVMSWGCDPEALSADPYQGAHDAVYTSVAKIVAAGADYKKAYLTLQEFFEKLRDEPQRWGKPFSALLGALDAQLELGAAAIGGKDSMSGSFEDLDVPPTLVSFAVAVDKLANVVSPEFKVAGSRVALIQPAYREDDLLPQTDSLLAAFEAVEKLVREGKALSVSTAGFGGLAEILFKACLGNKLGFQLSDAYYEAEGRDLFDHSYGCFVVELAEGTELPAAGGVEVIELGCTTQAYEFTAYGETLDMDDLQEAWASALEGVFPYRSAADDVDSPEELVPEERYRCEEEGRIRATYGGLKIARPRVVIPVFPGNNCEYDSARAFRAAGAEADIFVINNLTPENVAESTRELARRIRESQIVMIPGGFSGGDEPDGSAKFITAFFRAPEVTEAVRDLLQARDGLMLGICNGFQALIKLGLVPYGDIVDATADAPTLTFNQIGRHQSRLVRTRICSDLSPWLTQCDPDELYTVAISHGEGRFVANDDVLSQLREGGQIATQYVDVAGMPSMDLDVNPNGSVACIEGITSPDGRVFGKMGHVERRGDGLYKNVPGDKFMPLFESGVAYFA